MTFPLRIAGKRGRGVIGHWFDRSLLARNRAERSGARKGKRPRRSAIALRTALRSARWETSLTTDRKLDLSTPSSGHSRNLEGFFADETMLHAARAHDGFGALIR